MSSNPFVCDPVTTSDAQLVHSLPGRITDVTGS